MVHDMRGRILAHRGLWLQKSDQNSLEALEWALSEGFGFETDLRDFNSEIAISHDMADSTNLLLSNLLSAIRKQELSDSQILAWNIKADGLLNNLRAIEWPGRSFFFDMSFPQELQYQKAALPVAKRLSEYEKHNVVEEQGLYWLDAFEDDWYLKDLDFILPIINKTHLTLVSSELHGRDMAKCWDFFKKHAAPNNNLSICTDHPQELLRFL